MISGEETSQTFCGCGHSKLLHEKGGCAYYETKSYREKEGYLLRVVKVDEYCVCREYGERER